MPKSTNSRATKQGYGAVERRLMGVLAISRMIFNERHGRDLKNRDWRFERCDRGSIIAGLALDCPRKRIKQRAPWLTKQQSNALAREARTIKADGVGLGKVIGYTNDQRNRFKIWIIWPCDKSRAEIEEGHRMAKREHDRVQARKRSVATERMMRAFERTISISAHRQDSEAWRLERLGRVLAHLESHTRQDTSRRCVITRGR